MAVLTPVENPLEAPETPVVPVSTPTTASVGADVGAAYDQTTGLDAPTWETPSTLDTSITTGSEYLTPETRVSEQLTNLLASDSPYMKQVEAQSAERANQLGLLSSSMAVGAGQRAAIESALPIAQADASMAGQLQLGQQAAEYDISQDLISTQLNADYLTHKSEVENLYAGAMKAADTETAAIYQDAQNKWNYDIQVSLKDFDNQWSERLANGQVSQERYNNAMTSIGQITQNTSSNVAALLADPDIASMDAEVVASMLQNIQDHSLASIEFVGGVGGINPDELQVLLDSFSAATTWTAGEVPQDIV